LEHSREILYPMLRQYMRISGLHPDLVAAKILPERKLNSNFTEKLTLYLVIFGVTNPVVS
jgi:hypothetical protein